MANIYTIIQRKVNRDEFDFLPHSSMELEEEDFLLSDAVKVILKPFNYFALTDDESHIRYAFEGILKDGRMLRVIVFMNQSRVIIKTGYEIFD